MKIYDAKMVLRMLKGQWIFISTDVIYHCYDPSLHDVDKLEVIKSLPLRLSFDFNIALGKKMSSCLGQFNKHAKCNVKVKTQSK